MGKNILFSVIVILLSCVDFVNSQDLWVGKDGNIRNVDARAMIIDQEGLYLATKDEVYRARDAADKWESIFSLPSGENEIRCLGGRTRNIFVGTKRGLFRTQDYGKNWKNIFKTIIPEKNSVLCIEQSRVNPKEVYIGTERGIFYTQAAGDRWLDMSANLKNVPIKCILIAKDGVYAGGENGLYFKKDEVDGWQRLYVHYAAEKNNGEEPIELPEIEEAQEDGISCIASSGARLYVAIGRKILCSDDSGGNWRIFPCDGLNGTINYIAASAQGADRLYCATTKGVFEFVQDKGRWLELYKGIDKAISVNKLIFGGPKDAHLWAVTDRGLYRMEIGKYQEGQYIDVEKNLKSFKVVYSNEPTFKELQHAAMKFAEVDPEKIRNWRSESRLRALLPKVSFGIDKDSSTNSEIYTSATKDYIIMGPDDVTSGLDLSVSWELGDLIWSDDQTNIDVRSRLTTQLRNDILDDLRRAYFERRRLQFEMIQSPPKDINALFEKELRIEELTQAIDDLTGNYLSEHSKNMP